MAINISIGHWEYGAIMQCYIIPGLSLGMQMGVLPMFNLSVVHMHLLCSLKKYTCTVLVLSKLKTITATAPQPNRTVFKYFAIFKTVALILEPGETPSDSMSYQASNYVQRS